MTSARVPPYLLQHAVQNQGHRDEFFWNRTQQVIVIAHVGLGGGDGGHCRGDKTWGLSQDAVPILSLTLTLQSTLRPRSGDCRPRGGVRKAARGQPLFPEPSPARRVSHVPEGGACGSPFGAFFFAAPRVADCGV